jgi:mRNA-degrading endonuclease RelE of RelBE toxin-antitoxin system
MRVDLAGDVKRLSNMTPSFRLRVGDYRVLFEIEGDRIRGLSGATSPRGIRRRGQVMIQFHPEFLKKNGQDYVVLPHEEYVKMQELLEDAEDLLLLEQAKREDAGKPGATLEGMMARFGIAPEA